MLAGTAALLVGALVATITPTGQVDVRANPVASPDRVRVVAFTDHGVQASASGSITASADVRTAKVGTKFRIVGRVRTNRKSTPRVVLLSEQVSGRWKSRGRVRSDRGGAYKFIVRAGPTEGLRKFRAVAPRTGRLPVARTSRIKVTIVAASTVTEPDPTIEDATTEHDAVEFPSTGGPAPAGNAQDWAWLFDQSARWNPCAVIRWTYNPQGDYPAGRADMTRALARIAGISGLRFKYVGPTNYVAMVSKDSEFPPNADLSVGWASDTQVPRLKGSTVGLGGGWAYGVEGADVAYQIEKGYITLDKGARLRPGFDTDGDSTWGQVLTHEALHTLGLGHATGQQQVMYGTSSSSNHRYGAGDLTGMDRIGADGGCLP